MARVILCPERPLHIAMLCKRELNMRRKKKKRAQLQIKQLQISPAFHKFTLCHFTFKKRPTLLVFTNQKKSEADTCFNKKKKEKKGRTAFIIRVAEGHYRGGSVCTPSSKRGPPSPYLGATPAPSLCRCELCELLCFISWYILCIH